jgi:hypothetical protein
MISWRKVRWVGQVGLSEATKNTYRTLMGKPEGKIPLERSRNRKDNIDVSIDIRETAWGVFGWIYSA